MSIFKRSQEAYPQYVIKINPDFGWTVRFVERKFSPAYTIGDGSAPSRAVAEHRARSIVEAYKDKLVRAREFREGTTTEVLT